MNMIAVLDADKYYGTLDYLEGMREESDNMTHRASNDAVRAYHKGRRDTIDLVYQWLAESEVTANDV